MTKYFTLYYEYHNVSGGPATVATQYIFDYATFEYMNYEFDDEMDHLFDADLIELFSEDEAHMTFDSKFKINVTGVDQFLDKTLFEFLYDIDPIMDNFKKSISQTNGSMDMTTYLTKYTNRYYLLNFERSNIIGDWLLHELYSTNYDGVRAMQLLEQVTFAIYITLIIFLPHVL